MKTVLVTVVRLNPFRRDFAPVQVMQGYRAIRALERELITIGECSELLALERLVAAAHRKARRR